MRTSWSEWVPFTKAAVEVADRAFADPGWVQQRLLEAQTGEPMRAKEWGKAAFGRADIYVRWAVSRDKAEAFALERSCGRLLVDAGLWNRSRF